MPRTSGVKPKVHIYDHVTQKLSGRLCQRGQPFSLPWSRVFGSRSIPSRSDRTVYHPFARERGWWQQHFKLRDKVCLSSSKSKDGPVVVDY